MFQGGVTLNDIKYVPEKIFPSIKNYRIFNDDLFITVAGTLGIVGKIHPSLNGANLTENANKLTNLKCNKEFLLYVLMDFFECYQSLLCFPIHLGLQCTVMFDVFLF
jgi:type I restriction enzyme S subunit